MSMSMSAINPVHCEDKCPQLLRERGYEGENNTSMTKVLIIDMLEQPARCKLLVARWLAKREGLGPLAVPRAW